MAAKDCIFCKIANGQDEKTTLLYQDEKVVVFRDIRPATEHHFLICPREHIPNAKSLTSIHVPFVENLVDIGRQVLREHHADLSKTRFGFHWPPFCTISHLHLHAISPDDQIKFFYWMTGVFSPSMPWFKSADWVIQRLKEMETDITATASVTVDASPPLASAAAESPAEAGKEKEEK